MASKEYGTTRMVTPGTKAFALRRSDFNVSVNGNNINRKRSYFSETGGGYLLYDKERKFNQFEYEAAKHLADSGYVVQMTPERGAMYVTAHYKGKDKFSDGKIFGVTYEQKTPKPEGNNFDKNVEKAIEHAKSKGSRTALIYDAHDYLHRYNIQRGMESYMEHNKKSGHNTVEGVIVVSHAGKVYEWSF